MNYNQFRFENAISMVKSCMGSALEGKRWLDLGCGRGTFAYLLFSCGIDVTGVDDFDPELKKDNSWKYFQSDLSKGHFLFQDSSFDVVSALEIIEHIIDTDRFLDEIHRVLSRDGLLVISTPNICMLSNRIRVPLGYCPNGTEYRNLIHHVRAYNLASLVSQLKNHKFRVLSVRGVKFLPQKLMNGRFLIMISEVLAKLFPSLCANLVIVCRRI